MTPGWSTWPGCRRVLLAVTTCTWVALVLSCGVTDYHYTLPGGYEVWHTDARRTVITAGPNIDRPSPPQIESEVVGIGWDARYVLAERRTADGRQFWIIDTRDHVLHGPFDEPTFAARRAELGVSAGVGLRAPHHFAP